MRRTRRCVSNDQIWFPLPRCKDLCLTKSIFPPVGGRGRGANPKWLARLMSTIVEKHVRFFGHGIYHQRSARWKKMKPGKHKRHLWKKYWRKHSEKNKIVPRALPRNTKTKNKENTLLKQRSILRMKKYCAIILKNHRRKRENTNVETGGGST